MRFQNVDAYDSRHVAKLLYFDTLFIILMYITVLRNKKTLQ